MRKAFTFYSSYYESIKELPTINQQELYKAIIEYSFEKKDVKLTGISKSIWCLIKPNIDNNISKYENGKSPKQKGLQDKKENKKSESEAKQKQSVSSALSLSLSNKSYYTNKELNNIFIEYLNMRKKLKMINSERAINTLMNKLSNYDDQTKYKMIEQSIVKSWKSVYEVKEEVLPEWFNNSPAEEHLTEAEEQQMKERLKKYEK